MQYIVHNVFLLWKAMAGNKEVRREEKEDKGIEQHTIHSVDYTL